MSYKRIFIQTLPYIIFLIFFVAYSILSIVRHNNYQSFGYDLGINSQVVWHYSKFQAPITTIDHSAFSSKLTIHIELIYLLIAPFYWIWESRKMLLLLEAFFVCAGGIALYLLAKKKDLKELPSLAILIGYLGFYGVQNAMWFDVHSATFGASFTAFFIFFLISKKTRWAILFFVLAITTKENIAGTTFLISLVYFFTTKNKIGIYFAGLSLLYLAFVFGIYFPYMTEGGYRFQSNNGLFSNLNPTLMIDTVEKRQVFFYTLLSYGFLPLLNPLYLIPPLGNLAAFFILGKEVSTAQGLFLHYRVGLAPLMGWATIETIAKFKLFNNKNIAVYLILCTMLVQYTLHLPLSYLSKEWFWHESSGVKNIQSIIQNHLPSTASVVAQNNIVPHISHRDEIYSLFPEKRKFENSSPCEKPECNWFRWIDSPEFLLVDTSPEWDARHLLTNRTDFIDGLQILEKAQIITVYKRIGSTTLYKINKNLRDYN